MIQCSMHETDIRYTYMQFLRKDWMFFCVGATKREGGSFTPTKKMGGGGRHILGRNFTTLGTKSGALGPL